MATFLTVSIQSAFSRRLLLATVMTCTAFPVTAADIKPKGEIQAEPFPLSEVQLLDGPFKDAMERNATYLLSVDPDRLLHNTRQYAGLTPKGELYGGWETQGIAGHTLGHYLTALSQQFAATGDPLFRKRIDYIISEMAECQTAYGDGYIGALPPKELATLRDLKSGKVEIESGSRFRNGAWVPWYTQHKILAGLKDAWTLGGSTQAKEITLKLADWVDDITQNLTPEQQQTMLQVEHGGMLETLVELYSLTGNSRYLETSKRFYHHAIFDPLLANRDELAGKHANTQIPKIIGEAATYEITGDNDGRKIAEYFWDRVVSHHSWVIGGNSDREHFFPEGKAAGHLAAETAETCNTYNMLKLTGHLFEWEPKVALADYYERALYNHILASQEPKEGMFTYFVSLKPGHFRTYSTPTDSFWCCVGSGMENHTKYGGAIYFHDDDKLYINLFIPSTLTWKEQSLVLEQHTDYPQGNQTTLTVNSASDKPLAFRVRCPAWASGPLTFNLNGKPLAVDAAPGQYAEIRRIWKKGDSLSVTIPMALHTESLADTPGKVAFLYGPLVLAGDLGPAPTTKSFPYAQKQTENDLSPTVDVPVLVTTDTKPLENALHRVSGKELAWKTSGLGKPNDFTLRPFKDLTYNYYNVYWDVLSAADWTAKQAAIQAKIEQQRLEDARKVDDFLPGEQQSEIDHTLTFDHSQTGDFRDRKWRDASDGGWFEFQQKVLTNTAQVLRCTYWGEEAGKREFEILVEGKHLATQKLNRNQPGQFFDIDYPIPAEALAGKDKITIRFQPLPGNIAGGVFRCTILKAAP